MLAVLDAGFVAHVGVCAAEGPIVLPMAYGRTEDHLYLHGAAGNAILGAAIDHDVCATVTLVDGLVVARTAFHNSMNYRCVVIRGVASEVQGDDEKWEAMRLVSDHVTPTWESARTPTLSDLRKTRVLSIALDEMSGKVREGGPRDSDDDLVGPHWGGHIPLEQSWGAAVRDSDLPPGIETPPGVLGLVGTPLA